MRAQRLAVVLVWVASVLACTLTTNNSNPTPPSVASKPSVTIKEPASGTTFGVGDTITLHAEASDPGGSGVTRVELLVNNVIVDSQTSQNPLGESPLIVLLDYIAAVANPDLVLTVRAYRGVARSDDAAVRVVVNPRDGSSGTGATNATASSGGGNTVPAASYNPVCRARIDVKFLNFREGPSVDYDIIGRFALGDEAPLVGRLSDNSWWEVTDSGSRGWVSAAYTSLLGECNNIAVTTPPASPTPAATTIFTPAPNAPPNLLISTFTGTTNIVLTGGEAVSSYVLRVKNVGSTAAATAFNVTLFFPDGRTFDYTIGSLAAGEEKNVEGVIVTFSTPGTYRLEVLVDSSNNIAESNEQDNRNFLDIVVAEPTPTPEGQ